MSAFKSIFNCYFSVSLYLTQFAEHTFYMFSASTIAAASIAASLNGMNWHMRTGIQYIDLLQRLTALTGVKQVRRATQ